MSNISKIKISGTSYSIKDENACKVVELTQAQYDELPATAKTSNSLFVITDAQGADLSNYYTKSETDGLLDTKLDVTAYTPTDLSNYYTKSETSGATEISTALSSKADTATTYTKTETDNAITAATSTKQDTLVSGTNIKTINSQSILGEGNITIEGGSGGGKAIEAGRGISITTGETADTVSLNEAISASTASSSTYIAIGSGAKAEGGYKEFLTNSGGIAIGSGATANRRDICIGNGAKGYDNTHSALICIGLSSVSKQGGISIGNYSEAYGESGFNDKGGISIGFESKTKSRNAIAIGFNTVASGTTKTNINNQLKIDTSNQVYIYNKDNTEMICLQDQLGGSGSITIDQSLDSGSTNAVANSAITNAINDKVSNIYRDTTNWVGSGVTSLNVSYTGGSSTIKTYCASINNKPILTGSDHTKVNKFSLVETSAITTSVTSSSTDAQVPSAKAVYDQLGGLKLVKLTQSEYDSLTTKDNSTLYVIVN